MNFVDKDNVKILLKTNNLYVFTKYISTSCNITYTTEQDKFYTRITNTESTSKDSIFLNVFLVRISSKNKPQNFYFWAKKWSCIWERNPNILSLGADIPAIEQIIQKPNVSVILEKFQKSICERNNLGIGCMYLYPNNS